MQLAVVEHAQLMGSPGWAGSIGSKLTDAPPTHGETCVDFMTATIVPAATDNDKTYLPTPLLMSAGIPPEPPLIAEKGRPIA